MQARKRQFLVLIFVKLLVGDGKQIMTDKLLMAFCSL